MKIGLGAFTHTQCHRMTTSQLNLGQLPPIFILPTHLQADDLHEAEDNVYHAGGRLTYHINEARIFLGHISHKKRAAFDLRARGIWTEESALPDLEHVSKRRRLDGDKESDTISKPHTTTISEIRDKRNNKHASAAVSFLYDIDDHVIVLKLAWLDLCVKSNTLVPYNPYIVYYGKIIPKPADQPDPKPLPESITYIKAKPSTQTTSSSQANNDPTAKISHILSRNNVDSKFGHRRGFNQSVRSAPSAHPTPPPKLHRTTTSEFEEAENHTLPSLPDWLLAAHPQPLYSCLRSTSIHNPNEHFISQLTKIKKARLLTLDEIGVRAYSTSIAALAAYPYRITSPLEVSRLPGCDQKIATLWVDWRDSVTSDSSQNVDDSALDSRRTIPIVQDLKNDADLKVLRTLHEIWGVGPDTARRFYFQFGWKDLDDVVEFGWKTLNRVQQIGVKFYDEFQVKIPRTEVELIAGIVLKHARICKNLPKQFWSKVPSWLDGSGKKTDPRDFVCIIVGGYRRGKSESGDVDVILSHRDERMTQDLVVDVVGSLESEGYITHTLTLHTTTSDRGGNTLPFRADGAGGGHGFDSLDKALCVWQDPKFDDKGGTITKNPNLHRRVDIIVSSWKTVGTAVMGWSGGTTYQRDVRRWVKRERGWKFDSSGVRDRRDGKVIELEMPTENDTSDGWEDRERRLMEGLGVGWRPASERCTG